MTLSNEQSTRRRFLALLPGLVASVSLGAAWSDDARRECAMAPHRARRRAPQGGHPDPRPGIDGSHVLTKAQLTHNPEAAPVFDQVREIPQIADGIRCHCGCPETPGYRSLLNCFEGEGMAQHCAICQGQAKLAHKMFKRGKSLKEIRAAIDEEYE